MTTIRQNRLDALPHITQGGPHRMTGRDLFMASFGAAAVAALYEAGQRLMCLRAVC